MAAISKAHRKLSFPFLQIRVTMSDHLQRILEDPGFETLQQSIQQVANAVETWWTEKPAVVASSVFMMLYFLFLFLFHKFEHNETFRNFVGYYWIRNHDSSEEKSFLGEPPLPTTSNHGEFDATREATLSPSHLTSPNRSRNVFDLSSSLHMSFLNDLATPFGSSVDGLEEDEDLQPWTTHLDSPDVTHFCFLVHGYRSVSQDLAYMQVAMQRMAAAEKRKRASSATSSSVGLDDNSDGEDSAVSDQTPPPSPPPSIDGDSDQEDDRPNNSSTTIIKGDVPTHDMVVHNAICNEHNTSDGIVNAGNRLVDEIREVIRNEMKKRHPELETEESKDTSELYDVTMSMVGNSLGGLFARYAIAELVERHCVFEMESKCYVLDSRYRLHLNIFCTTATPHLGISRHTYFKIPRTAEIALAHGMGNTGKDIFRLNDLLFNMGTTPKYLDPLAAFRKRIAYANAYATDFPVPAGTAAFLSDLSTYPHVFTSEEEFPCDSSQREGEAEDLIIGVLTTPRKVKDSQEREADSGASTTEENSILLETEATDSGAPEADNDVHEQLERQLHQMSESLDRLGWKKVFVDIRNKLPNAEVPSVLLVRRRNSESDLTLDSTELNLHSLRTKSDVVRSKDVAKAVALPTDNRLALPFGHNMLVAFSRTRLSSFVNKGGRPVVDGLAKELVENIFQWEE